MTPRKLILPLVGDDVMYMSHKCQWPAKVVCVSRNLSVAVDLVVFAMLPHGNGKVQMFWARSDYGNEEGQWQWPEDLKRARISIMIDDQNKPVPRSAESNPYDPLEQKGKEMLLKAIDELRKCAEQYV